MRLRLSFSRCLVAAATLVVGLGPARPAAAQTVTGQASAVQSTVSGLLGSTTTVLGYTGALGDPTDARQASALVGELPSVLSAETLHATTIGLGNGVASEASLAGLALTVAGTSVGAEFVMSRAETLADSGVTAISTVSGLSINGEAVAVDSTPNQVIAIPGGQIVVNEQQVGPAGAVVNALRITVSGVADVIVASATAAIQ
jgi:hypothetical protein